MAFLKTLFGPDGSHKCSEVVLVEHEQAKSRHHVLYKLKEMETLGGEGLMLRKPGSFVLFFVCCYFKDMKLILDPRRNRVYEGHRSNSLLKVKVCVAYVQPLHFTDVCDLTDIL